MHVKDSGPDREHYQVPVGTGLLDAAFLVESLAAAGYGGDLVVEYLGPRGFRQTSIDYARESVKMKELLEKELDSRGIPRQGRDSPQA